MQSFSNNIIQWNLNGLYRNLDDIKLIINLHKPIAICLQETKATVQFALSITQ